MWVLGPAGGLAAAAAAVVAQPAGVRVVLTVTVRARGPQLPEETWKATVDGINKHFDAAEAHTAALYWRNFASCLTGYIADFCLANPYDAHLRAMSAFVDEQNAKVYNPRGLVLVNPLDRGLRVIEVTHLPGKAVILEKTAV